MFTLGVDFGTNSVRALVVRCSDGAEFGSRVVGYPSGAQGVLLDPKDGLLARQHPGDYLFGLEESIRGALAEAGRKPDFDPSKVVGIGLDSTGSSPIPVDAQNRPLALSDGGKAISTRNAGCGKITPAGARRPRSLNSAPSIRPQYIAKCGGVYSSEWFWAKLWHCLNVAPETFAAAYSWVELADWAPSVLAGVADPRLVKRGVCAAGHKALYSDDWGGLPDKEFLSALDPRLAEIRDRLYEKAYDASEPAGSLCSEWAAKLGLPAGIPIAIGEFDVHYGAIGCGVREGTLVKVIGTSTCDCAVVSAEKRSPIFPASAASSKAPSCPGSSASKPGSRPSATFSNGGSRWSWAATRPARRTLRRGGEAAPRASRPSGARLEQRQPDHSRRSTPHRPALLGQDLYTTRAEIYRALIEATAFGARAIIERVQEYGVRIDQVVCTGGIAEKNPLLMQIYADVTGCDMQVAGSSQTCALGSAIAAAVLAGAHPDFASAEAAMTSAEARVLSTGRRESRRLRRTLRPLPRAARQPSAA